jgi:hypothetical protein
VSDEQIRNTAIAYYTSERRQGRVPTGYSQKRSVQLELVETKVLLPGDLVVFAHKGDVEKQGAVTVGRARENRAKCAVPVDEVAVPANKKAKQRVRHGQQTLKQHNEADALRAIHLTWPIGHGGETIQSVLTENEAAMEPYIKKVGQGKQAKYYYDLPERLRSQHELPPDVASPPPPPLLLDAELVDNARAYLAEKGGMFAPLCHTQLASVLLGLPAPGTIVKRWNKTLGRAEEWKYRSLGRVYRANQHTSPLRGHDVLPDGNPVRLYIQENKKRIDDYLDLVEGTHRPKKFCFSKAMLLLAA